MPNLPQPSWPLPTHVFNDDVGQAAICHVGPFRRTPLLLGLVLPDELLVEQGVPFAHRFLAEVIVSGT